MLYPAPCCLYDPDEIRALYLVPYQEAITKVLAWSGEWTYRYWEMLFGYNGWVEVGQGWVDKWETDFVIAAQTLFLHRSQVKVSLSRVPIFLIQLIP